MLQPQRGGGIALRRECHACELVELVVAAPFCVGTTFCSGEGQRRCKWLFGFGTAMFLFANSASSTEESGAMRRCHQR